jgi:hypothetical protein
MLDSSPRTDRGHPYVPLYPTGDNTALFTISSIEGEQNRFFIVNVRGRTVIIDVSAPVKEFDAFLSKAQQPLNTKEGARCSGPRGTLARCSGKQKICGKEAPRPSKFIADSSPLGNKAA